ncbi:MAG: ribosome biogenesis GTP-binding protein YihA/YsxC [Opitutales bacterium]
MKIHTAEYRASANTYEACPPSSLPEFAFVGRSNVGKSSLINMLTGKTELAHTSGKPGKTRLINFFRINEAWTLVDLPGYGYAKVSRAQQEEFNIHVSAYLTERENLVQVFLLVDSQLEPQGGDLSFAEWMQRCGVPYSIIFTKTDRGSETKVRNHAEQFREAMEDWELRPGEVFHCSAKTGKGRGPILSWIESRLPKKTGKKTKKKTARVNVGWMNLKR